MLRIFRQTAQQQVALQILLNTTSSVLVELGKYKSNVADRGSYGFSSTFSSQREKQRCYTWSDESHHLVHKTKRHAMFSSWSPSLLSGPNITGQNTLWVKPNWAPWIAVLWCNGCVSAMFTEYVHGIALQYRMAHAFELYATIKIQFQDKKWILK